MTSTKEELYNKKDYSSLSNSHEAVVTHINLTWNIDFTAHVFSGCVDHDVKILVDGTQEVHFDSSRIHIAEGADAVMINRSIPAKFRVEDRHEVLGSRIAVEVPADLRKKDTTFKITFRYSIDPEASAVQWLPAAATKGGECPFVFTQCQAIHARSLLPCMDSPAVKTTYTATVTAPKWCTVLMSALSRGSNSEGDLNTFQWEQPVPTPAYLIALAGGRMSSKDVSDRVRIWAEPEVIEAAHYEFDETEDFVKAAEEITGCPYQWTRYDVLCLPPSFPYGGMENPCLTFATPTLLAGDKSLADVIAHEIAHSWTGNLVTNHTWDHFWLNEGWTVWLERKITSKYKQNDEVGVLSAQIGYKHLKESVDLMGADNQFTRLIWPLKGEDPDDAFSSVPYEKGFNMLNQLENLVGRENFEAFAKRYIDTFKFSTVTSGDFRDCFVNFMDETLKPSNIAAASAEEETAAETGGKKNKKNKKKKPTDTSAPVAAEPTPENKAILDKIQALDWDKLFLTPGMPEYVPCFKNSLSAVAEELANKWIQHAVSNAALSPSKSDIEGWGSSQICLFLEALANHTNADGSEYDFDVCVLEEINAAYGLNERNNAEIKLRWHTLCLRSNAAWIVPYVTDFITSQGRMKFVRPLYRALRMSKVGGKLAQRVFDEKKDMYHPIARKMLDADLTRLAAQLDDSEDEVEEEECTAAEGEVSEGDDNTAPSLSEHVVPEKVTEPIAEEVPATVNVVTPVKEVAAPATPAKAGPASAPSSTAKSTAVEEPSCCSPAPKETPVTPSPSSPAPVVQESCCCSAATVVEDQKVVPVTPVKTSSDCNKCDQSTPAPAQESPMPTPKPEQKASPVVDEAPAKISTDNKSSCCQSVPKPVTPEPTPVPAKPSCCSKKNEATNASNSSALTTGGRSYFYFAFSAASLAALFYFFRAWPKRR